MGFHIIHIVAIKESTTDGTRWYGWILNVISIQHVFTCKRVYWLSFFGLGFFLVGVGIRLSVLDFENEKTIKVNTVRKWSSIVVCSVFLSSLLIDFSRCHKWFPDVRTFWRRDSFFVWASFTKRGKSFHTRIDYPKTNRRYDITLRSSESLFKDLIKNPVPPSLQQVIWLALLHSDYPHHQKCQCYQILIRFLRR